MLRAPFFKGKQNYQEFTVTNLTSYRKIRDKDGAFDQRGNIEIVQHLPQCWKHPLPFHDELELRVRLTEDLGKGEVLFEFQKC